jgi:hypothetical protein
MHLGSWTSVLLVQLHTVGGSFSCDYRLCDALNSFLSCVVSLKDFLAQSMRILCLLNQSIPRMISMPFESKTIRLAIKSTPLIFKIQPKAYCLSDTSLLRLLSSIQKQHRHPECLRGYIVNSSLNVVLLDSARVGFPRQFSANGH